MKLKYKKIVLIISLGTMLIGMATFSINSSNNKSTKQINTNNTTAQPSINENDNQDNDVEKVINLDDYIIDETDDEDENVDMSNENVIDDENITKDNTLISDKKGNKDKKSNADAETIINNLVKTYFQARLNCNKEMMKTVVNNIDYVDMNTIKDEAEYVENYSNIECHIKDGLDKNTYIVYVYNEMKIKDIDTVAPSIIMLYISKGADGNLCIFFGDVDNDVEEFVNDLNSNDKEILNLIDNVNKKMEEALSKDKDLRKFVNDLNNKK